MSSDSVRQSGNAQTKNSTEVEVQTYWFIARGDVLMGPFNSTQVADRLKTREFSAFDFCWREGFQEWRPLSSVDEFERRGKMQSLSPYPKIEIPSAQTSVSVGDSSGKSQEPNSELSKNTKNRFRLVSKSPSPQIDEKLKAEKRNFVVSFARVKKSPLSIYEWTLALALTLGFAYLTSHFALQEIENNLHSRLRYIEAGKPLELGEFIHKAENEFSKEAMPPEVWAPMYSAPGFSDFVKNTDLNKVGFFMEVSMLGSPRVGPNGLSVKGYLLSDWGENPAIVDTIEPGLDPIFQRNIQIRGYLSPKNGQKVHFMSPGYPGIP